MTGALTVEFCGEFVRPDAAHVFTIGRDADLTLDDQNRYLHRHFLTVHHERQHWWISNVGQLLTATVSDVDGLVEAWLAPGARLPVVVPASVVRFTAGPITYDFTILLADAAFTPAVGRQGASSGSTTVGRVALNHEQKLLVLALAEHVLRRGREGPIPLPSNAEAADRLAWPLTKFNRKLDYVCGKLAAAGVRGLHGGADRLASGRRARLVEYALAVRLVTRHDLALLATLPRHGDAEAAEMPSHS